MTFQIAIVLLISLAVIFVCMRLLRDASPPGQHLYKSKPLLSENEKEFFLRLSQALPDCYVLTQVGLGALLQPNVKNNNQEYYRARGTYSQKIADYVICDNEMSVLAVVELDDRTHRKDKDAKRDAMLEQAGYKVIRWDSKNKPTAEEIRQRF
jgi:hypothetical protein